MVSNLQLDTQQSTSSSKIDRNLKRVKNLLFGIGVTGQWIFVFYIVAFYGGIVWTGQYDKINQQLPHGIIEGDLIGNIMLGIHLALAAVITFGGPLQFFPVIRNRFPVLHRWIGRIYFVTAFLITGAGLYMSFTRGSHGGWIMGLGNTINASLIMYFSVMAWRKAIQRDFKNHKKWAIRAFLMVSGVWFFRMGYGMWILLTGFTAIGTASDLTGPFDRFLAFGHSLVPLLILEFYFFAKAHANSKFKKAAIGLLGLSAILLTMGIVMVTLLFWLPVL